MNEIEYFSPFDIFLVSASSTLIQFNAVLTIFYLVIEF